MRRAKDVLDALRNVAPHPPAMSEEQIRQARALLTRPDESVSSIARLLGISRTTLCKYLPELTAKN